MRLFLAGSRRYRFNSLESARAAGWTGTDDSLRVRASQCLHTPRNMLRVNRMLQRLDIESERTMEEIRRCAFYDPADFVTWDNAGVTIKASNELDDDQRSAIVAVTERKGEYGTSVELKFADKLRALEILCKYQALAAGAGPIDPEAEKQPFTLNLGPTTHNHQHVHIHNGNGGPTTNGHAAPPTSGEETNE